jgi:hypothetical protein
MANKYLKFEYWNTCDLGDIYYQGGQHFWFYLDGDVLEPFHEDTEDGQEDGDGDFVPTFRRQMKRYRIKTSLVPDYLIDAIQRMKLHDNIELTFKTGEVEQIYNLDVEPEWQFEKKCWQGTVVLTFDMDEKVVLSACCDNLTVGIVVPPEPIPDLYWVMSTGSNNSGDGSYANPWQTFGYATTQAVTPGDIIHMKANDTVTETVQSALSPGVSMIGAGVTSIIHCHYAGTYESGVIALHSAVANPVDGNQSISYLRFEGSSLTSNAAVTVRYRKNVKIHNCTFIDFNDSAVNFFNNNNGYIAAPTINYATGNELHDCIITNCSGITNRDIVGNVTYTGQDGLLIYDNVFTQTARAAGSNGNIIKCFWQKDVLIYDNTFYKNNLEAGQWNFFLEQWNYIGGCEIHDNIFYGLAAVDLGGNDNSLAVGETFGYKVYNNQFLNAANASGTGASVAISIEGHEHQLVYVYNNLIQRYGVGIAMTTASEEINYSMHDIYIYYNILESIGWTDSAFSYGVRWLNETPHIGYANTGNNINIVNNVITAMVGATYQGIGVYGNGDLDNLNIKNNIIYNFDNDAVHIGEANGHLVMDIVNIIYNDFFSNGTDAVDFDTAGIDETNVDILTGNITGNPLFHSATVFHLEVGSPCINAGINVGLAFITVDYAGDPIGAVPEIGAYKY